MLLLNTCIAAKDRFAAKMKNPVIKISISAVVFMAFTVQSYGLTEAEYIKKYKDCAIEQMLVYNIPASVTIAQGILESECGNSTLAVYANNHFGIKCHDDWNGPYYVYDDDARGEHFRKYTSVNDSYKDHAKFIKARPWYTFLFNYKRNDYRNWANGLEKAGYATAPDYAQQIIFIIERNQLYLLDTVLQKLQGFGVLEGVDPNSAQKEPQVEYVTVQPHDCIYKIAREYGVEVHQLCRNNGISIKEKLLPGQRIYLKDRSSSSVPASNNKRSATVNNKDLALLPKTLLAVSR